LIVVPVLAADLSSYAFVNDNGTLRIRGRTLRLFGVYLPPTDPFCEADNEPDECIPQAVAALKFKVGSNFVKCDFKGQAPNGALFATCRAEGKDLAAYLLERGWAAALPEAPPEYAILERIARERGLGVWNPLPTGEIIVPRQRRRLW
jgi:endonuclease YncB( thermonuclease family)